MRSALASRLDISVLSPLLLLALTVVAPGQEATPGAAGLRAVHVGNSHSHPLRLLDALAPMVGHKDQKNSHINILGAPLRWNWDHGEQNKWPQTLAPTNAWDAVTLLSWAEDDGVYAPKFAGEALRGNPRCQVYVYVIWPDANMDFEKPPAIRSEAHGEAVAAAVAKAFPDAPKPRVIPASLLIRELGRLADRGELPHVATRFELFTDSGHLSQYGQYAVTTLVCAMLYQESPLTYPADICRADTNGKPIRGPYQSVTVPPDTAEAIKRTVWDILLTYPPSGIKPGLIIADRRLVPVIAGQPYKAELKALNADGKCEWSLAKGRLPDGLSLSPDGVLAGRSGVAGDYPITLKVTDSKASFERPVVLTVSPDRPPAMPDQTLPAATLDQYVFQPIKAEGGVGHITWSVSDGKLPWGVMLTPAGILIGSPGEQGAFTFTITASDSHPAGARSGQKTFTWAVNAARPEALLVKSIAATDLKLDGKLDEPFWMLDQPIAKRVLGTPTAKASFGAVWVVRGGNNPMTRDEGTALVLAVKILDGPAGKTPRDGVHFFIDGRHNKEVIYNADDTHFFVPRQQNPKRGNTWANWVSGKPNWFTQVQVAEIEGGYTVELSLGFNYFVGEGNWLPFAARGVYGFDIAVDQGDEKNPAQQTWRGDEQDAQDTSHFGTIVLVH